MDGCIQQIFCLIELPILSRGPTHFMDIYPELVVQHDVSTQADMFLACSSPKEPATPVMLDSSYSQTITDDTYVNDICMYLYYVKLYSLQEEYLPADDTTAEDEEELPKEEAIRKENKFLVFESCPFKLLKQCCSCGQEVELNTSARGTLLVVNGTCPDGHVLTWQSQPLIRDVGAGNLLVAAAVLLCGLTFTGISNFAKLLNLAMFSESTFYRLQKEYLFPVIHTNYGMQQGAVIEFLRGNDLKLSGDGRCDSLGYSAKYCTYSLMDSATDLILDYKLIQSSETGSSVAMEKEGLRRSLNYLLERNVSINTIATDRHKGVGALMKSEYPYNSHQYDVWHMAKGVVKQLTQKGKLKHCERLLLWMQSISNHLWWAAQTCNGDAQLLTEKWTSIVYHISNVHEWDGGEGSVFNKCVHPTLPPEEQRSKKWLRSGSLVHTTLKNIVYNKTLLWDIKKLKGFHHTSALEVFHSLLLKYCPKRQHFSYVGM